MAGDSWGDCAVPMIQDSCYSRFEDSDENSVLRAVHISAAESMATRSTLGHSNGRKIYNLRTTAAAATTTVVVAVVVVPETVAVAAATRPVAAAAAEGVADLWIIQI